MTISQETLRQKCDLEPWVIQKAGHIKFGNVPEQFQNIAKLMPDGSTEQQNFLDAAEHARNIYREQIQALIDPGKLTADSVRKMCRDEPWTTASRVEDIHTNTFGYVIEKFKSVRDMFSSDTSEYVAFNTALEIARAEYFQQMHNMARSFATGKSRAKVEEMNSILFAMSHRKEDNGTFVGNRLYTLCELNGEYFRLTGEHIPRPEGVEQLSANGATITKLKP